jgi:hypothetical protein
VKQAVQTPVKNREKEYAKEQIGQIGGQRAIENGIQIHIESRQTDILNYLHP